MTGKWYADGVDLSSCAFGVQNRSATWGLAARRGENAAIPGRDGTVWVSNKPYDENVFELEMFAAGADEAGLIPPDETRAEMVRRNLDRISRIFGHGRLMTLAYVEDPTQPYGRVNLITNPSFQTSAGTVTVRENVLPNPSGEYSGGLTVIRRNQVTNPGFERIDIDFPVRRNLVPNPRMSTGGRVNIYRTNLAANPSFELTTNSWGINEGAKIARKLKSVSNVWPVFGKYSMKVNPAGGGDQVATGGPCTVKAGTTYTLSAYVLNGSGSTRQFRVKVVWRDKKGANISAAESTNVGVAVNNAGRPTITATAPAGATAAYIKLIGVANNANDEWYWDGVLFEAAAAAYPFFSGSSAESDGVLHSWAGAAEESASYEYWVEPRGWRSDRWLLTTTAQTMRGRQSARVLCGAAAPAGTLVFGQVIKEGCDVADDRIFSGLLHAKPRTTSTFTHAVAVRLACYNEGGTYLGPLQTSGGVNIADTVSTLEDGTWTAIETTGGYVQPGTVRICLEARVSGTTWAFGEYAYFDGALVEPEIAAGEYFDGDMPAPEDFDYKWLGTADWSESILAGATIGRWEVTSDDDDYPDPVFYQTGPGLIGNKCLRVEAKGPIEVSTEPEGLRPGTTQTFSIHVRPDQDLDAFVFISADGVDIGYIGGSITAGEWIRLPVSAEIPEDVGEVRVGMRAIAAPGDVIDLDAAMFEEGSELRPYFDGDSGSSFAWEGDPADSSSVWREPRADGWALYGPGRPGVYRTSSRFSPGTALSSKYSVVAVSSGGDYGVTAGRDNVVADQTYTFACDVAVDQDSRVRIGLVWADSTGADISEDTTSITGHTAAAGWTRMSVTADPPPGAAVVSAYVLVWKPSHLLPPLTGDKLYVDRAILGFGGDGTYADGDSPGWVWTGTKHNSESRELAPGVAGWYSNGNLTLERSDEWSDHLNYSGKVVITDVDGPHLVYSRPVNSPSPAGFYRNEPDRSITFAVDIQAEDAGRVQLELWPLMWNGSAMVVSPTDPIAATPQIQLVNGGLTRPVIHASFPDSTHFFAVIRFLNGIGGAAIPGATYYLDRAIAGFGAWSGEFFDGDDANAVWLGAANNSASQYFGPARVASVEVRDAVDINDRGYGTSAKFTVRLHAPGVYFRDAVSITSTIAIAKSGTDYPVEPLRGGTARINDAIIRIYGPITSPRFTDLGSGAWVSVAASIPAGQYLELDSDDWSATLVAGSKRTNVIELVRHGGAMVMAPISPLPGTDTPHIRIEGSGIGSGAKVVIITRRAYHLA